MRRVVYSEFGDPTRVLGLGDRPMPQPGKGEVRILMLMSPIHNHDLSTIAGTYGVRPPLPAVPGTEAVGMVDALGEGVTNLAVGQRVMGGASASWAEYYLGDASRLVPVPDSVSDETACQLISMPLSAKMILHDLGVQPGDWMIQNAANGAVGKLLARFATDKGVHVINVVRRDAGIAEMQAQGLANVVSSQTDGWQDQAKALANGAPIIRGLDSVGGDGPEALLTVMAERGELVSFGNLSGRPVRVSSQTLLFKQQVLRGFWAARTNIARDIVGGMIGELVHAAASGALVLPVDGVFGLEQAAAAAGASNEPGRTGKVVFRGL